MLFTSVQYIFLFLPIVFILLRLFNKASVKLIVPFLIISSLYFYSVWDFKFLFLLIISIIFNYFVGKNIISTFENKKKYLYFGIFINVLILIYYKYLNFFITNINSISSYNFDVIDIIFPLALSFYTLQQIAFLIDCFDEKIKEVNLEQYFLFISFFPQLFAGTIVLYEEAYHQYEKSKIAKIDYKNLYLGLIIFTIGISKKVLLADTLSIPVNEGFGLFLTYPEMVSFADAWVSSLLFTFQIYFDFSGYTDMAIGAALLFNVRLPINFLSPYKANSIISFWQKWHITLSNFINQYCFNRLIYKYRLIDPISSKIAIIIIMTVVGFWHGPSWGYIFFGLFHGLAISINYFWKDTAILLNKYVSWFITFITINVGFVFFRTPDVFVALEIIKKMFSYSEAKIFISMLISNNSSDNILNITTISNTVILFIIISVVIIFFSKNTKQIVEDYEFKLYHLIFYIPILLISILRIRGVEFIYFAF